MTSNTISKVLNYQGSNSFILKMKEVINQYKGLTEKQISAVEKILSSNTKINIENLNDDLKKIAKYQGINNFVIDIRSKLMEYGTLTNKQISSALNQIDKESKKTESVKVNIPTVGETIKVGRTVGTTLKKKYNLKFNPILLDITKVKSVSSKAVLFSGKMTVKRGDVCMCCAKTLTDELSMLTGVGKICAKNMGIEYLTDVNQAEEFRNEYLNKVNQIGEMEFWVPKTQIKKWNGKTKVILKMI